MQQLIPRVHSELHRIAKHYMAGESHSHTLEPSALINEAYIRLVDGKNLHWKDRCHFFAVAAQILRRVLVDYARARAARKRGGLAQRTTLSSAVLAGQRKNMDLVLLNTALERLSGIDLRKSRVVDLRVFGGLTIEKTAQAMGVAPITVRRHWDFALAWLRKELREEMPNGS